MYITLSLRFGVWANLRGGRRGEEHQPVTVNKFFSELLPRTLSEEIYKSLQLKKLLN